MLKSTFISLGLHFFFILIAYYGLPHFKSKEPIEQPIDIVEDTPVSSKTSLKLGKIKEKKVKNEKKEIIKEEKVVKKPPPPPPLPSKKTIDKKNEALKKKKEIKEIAELVKKKPKLKIKKKKKKIPPKVISKPEKIKKKQKEQLAKGILKTLSKSQPNQKKSKKDKNKNNKEVLSKLKQIVGNSNKRVLETEVKLSQTEYDKIKNYVGKCWETSIGASEVKMIIPLKVSANMDGSINSVEIVENSMYLKDTFYRATADSARRAVLDCSPLPLPKNKAELFKSFIFDFDPSFIYRY